MSYPIKLYRHALSGHSHRVELFLSILKLDYTLIDVDLSIGEQKQTAFVEKNTFGQVPVVDDNGVIVADSNAILVYLATTYDTNRTWLPQDPERAAQVQRFLSVAAGPIAYGPAAARLVNVFGATLDYADALEKSVNVLGVLDRLLAARSFLTGELTIADIAAYTYIAHAPEGGVSLQPYPHVGAWLNRIESLSNFIPMQSTRVGLAA